MVSSKLVFSPKLKYDSFVIQVSTRESLNVWIPVVNALLNLSTNATFSGNDFRDVYREEMAHSHTRCIDEETMGGEVYILKKVMPRRDFEAFRRDLVRLQEVPEWWKVSCDLVDEGGKIKLIPEKSKEDDFYLFYFESYPLLRTIDKKSYFSPIQRSGSKFVDPGETEGSL